MSEKFELIDAKDLPMTEEEDVTVLCVGADGEMKRRDAGSFGMKASELAELPTTEAEEVDVICVDAEGKLCRKSSASFGGGGSGGNQVFFITREGDSGWRVPTGTYKAISDLMLADNYYFIIIAVIDEGRKTRSARNKYFYCDEVFYQYDDTDGRIDLYIDGYGAVFIHPDDSCDEYLD